MTTFILIFHLCFFTSCDKEATETLGSLKRLEKKILKIVEQRSIPALSLQIRKGEVVLNINYNHPDTKKQTIYGIGSTTKFLSATLIFKLIEEGKLNLDELAVDYVKDLARIEGAKDLSVKNLLNHTSGLSDYTMSPAWRETVVKGEGPTDFEKKFSYVNYELKNSGTYSYSNTNYLILQKLVEIILSKPYKTSFNEFYENQGLANIRMGYSGTALQAFYAENDKGSANVSTWQENYGYDGGVYSDPKEMNDFLQKFFVEKKILQESTIDQMIHWIPTGSLTIPIGKGNISQYGNGIMKLEYDNQEYLGHAGGTLKYQSFMFHNVADNTSISMVTNCSGKYYNTIFFQEILPEILENL